MDWLFWVVFGGYWGFEPMTEPIYTEVHRR